MRAQDQAHGGTGFQAAREAAHRLGAGRVVAPVRLPLGDALGSVLAEDLHARSDVPVADASAMDGFAVRGEGPWRVLGRVLAGGAPAAPLTPGVAVEVATGALVPDETGGVLPVEVVRVDAGVLHLDGPRPDRRHVRPRGEECRADELLLPAGRRVRPGVVGLAASTGSDTLLVRRPPRVAVLLTGDELVVAGLPAPGQVRDAVGPLLPGAVASLGGELVSAQRCGDAPGELAASLERIVGDGGRTDRASQTPETVETRETPQTPGVCDVVVTCGMAGMGPADRLRPWLAEVGATLVVDGVAVRPGHPMVLAVLPDGRPLVGLPGNPLAAVAALLGLLGPLLDGMTGLVPPEPERSLLSGWEPRGRPATVLLPVRRRADRRVEPAGMSGPAQLRGLAAADAVAVVPPGWSPADDVELLPLP